MIKRRVLMIAYHFPPLGGMGSLRVTRFAKYLPRHGWRPTILTVRDDPNRPKDVSLLTQLPNHIQVARTRTLNCPTPWSFFGNPANSAGPERARTRALRTSQTRSPAAVMAQAWAAAKLRVRDTILFPDPQIGWVPFALWRAARMLSSQSPDSLFVTGPPWSALLCGVALKRYAAVPLVTDLRDPLLDYAFRPTWSAPQRAVIRRLERLIVHASDQILVVSDEMKEKLILRYGQRCETSVVTITNSFDPDDFADVHPAPEKNAKFSMAYVGSLYRSITPRTFLDGFSLFVQETGLSPRDVSLTFAGNIGPEAEDEIRSPGLRGFVETLGFLPHADSITLIRGADLLILIVPDVPQSDAILTGKLFEYLAARKPILALVPDGAARDLLLQSSRGACVHPSDVTGVSRVMYDAYRSWKAGDLNTRVEDGFDLEQYSTISTTRRLASLLDSLVS